MKVITHSENETCEFAKSISHNFKAGSIVCLDGQMGAGKTHFVKGVLEAFGYTDEVTSPTFSLCHRYEVEAGFSVLHYDLYRLSDYDDLYSIGFFDDVNENNCVFIEWSGLAAEYLDEKVISVKIEYGKEPDERIITVEGIEE